MKEKLKSPRFWTAAVGALTMILLAVGIRVPAPVVNEILGAISAILVLFGFIRPPAEEDGVQDGNDIQNDEETGNK